MGVSTTRGVNPNLNILKKNCIILLLKYDKRKALLQGMHSAFMGLTHFAAFIHPFIVCVGDGIGKVEHLPEVIL